MKNRITNRFFLMSIALSLSLGLSFNASSQDFVPECNASFFWDTTMKPVITIYPPAPPDKHQYFQAVYSGQISYVWDFGDGTSKDSVSGNHVKHLYENPGNYLVTLTVNTGKVYTENPCTDTRSTWIKVKNPKLCDAGFEPVVMVLDGDTYTHTMVTGFIANKYADSLLYDFRWDFGDGSTGSGPVINHKFENEGIFKVVLSVKSKNTASGNFCSDFSSQTISTRGFSHEGNTSFYCEANLLASQTKNELIIRDKNVYMPFRYDGINITRSWDWGDGTIEHGSEFAEHTYHASGTYIVTLTKSAYYDPCYDNKMLCYGVPVLRCQEKTTLKVIIKNHSDSIKCPANIVYSSDGKTVKFNNNLVIDHFDNHYYETYEWVFGDGKTGTGSSVVHTYDEAGAYKIVLIKTLFYNPCLPDTNGIKCLAMPWIICKSETMTEIVVSLKDTTKNCKATFDWNFDRTRINIKTKGNNQYIGYAKLDFGDGDWVETNGSSIVTSHNYLKPGNYEICFRVATVPDSILQYMKLSNYCTDTYCQSVVVNNKIVDGLDDYMTLLNVSVHPNPANDKATFTIINSKGLLDLKILDAWGYLVKEVKGLDQQQEAILISDLKDGVYVYSLSDANGVLKNGKLIVAR